jgi:hypothetical protein
MNKIINILCIIAATITSIVIICTFLTSYQFYYVGLVFNSYLPIQIGVAITMSLIGIKFLLNENGLRRIVYFLFSMIISMIILFSITMVK